MERVHGQADQPSDATVGQQDRPSASARLHAAIAEALEEAGMPPATSDQICASLEAEFARVDFMARLLCTPRLRPPEAQQLLMFGLDLIEGEPTDSPSVEGVGSALGLYAIAPPGVRARMQSVIERWITSEQRPGEPCWDE